jgi:ribosomal protein L28
MNATKRKFNPNLLKKKVYDPKTGRTRKMKISAAALRTLVKRASR